MASKDDHRKEFDALKAEVDAFRATDEAERLIPLKDGATMRLTRDPSVVGGVQIQPAGLTEPFDMRTYHADQRPEGFPDDVPFLPDATIIVSRKGDPLQLFSTTWMMASEVSASFEEVVGWHRDAGWAEVEDPADETGVDEAMEKARAMMRAKGRTEEEIEQAVEGGLEIVRSGRRVRRGKDGVIRTIGMMELPGGQGVVTLFAKSENEE